MRRPLPLVLDLVIALALVALGQSEVWSAEDQSARGAAIASVGTLPLALRRFAPGVVVGICVLAMLLHSVERTDEFTIAQLLGLMLAMYTAAERIPMRPALVALGAGLAAGLSNSAAAGRTDPGSYAFPVILLGVPWAAGTATRRWRERTMELRDLTEQLTAERAAHAEAAVAAERGRIARDLHDSLAQSLNAMVVHAEAAQAVLDINTSRAGTSLTRIQQEGRRALRETRHLLVALRDHPQTEGLRIADISALVTRVTADGLEVNLVIDGSVDCVSAPIQAAVYRIVQESLTNIGKHSTARHANVDVVIDSSVVVTVRDDGDGHGAPGRGLGLVGMRERATLLGGTLRAEPTPTGFVVSADFPTEEPL